MESTNSILLREAKPHHGQSILRMPQVQSNKARLKKLIALWLLEMTTLLVRFHSFDIFYFFSYNNITGMMTGKLNSQQLFMGGKLKVRTFAFPALFSDSLLYRSREIWVWQW